MAFTVVRSYVNDKERYDCIPSTWIRAGGFAMQSTVDFKFPSFAELGKGKKFKKNQKALKKWPEYMGKMLMETDSQAKAFKFIEQDKARRKQYNKECGITDSSDTDDSDSEEENSSKQTATKRKLSEQKNEEAKSKKMANEANKKLLLQRNERAKELRSYCYNFYDELNASHKKSISILDTTADYLQNIIKSYNENVAAKATTSSPTSTNQKPSEITTNDSKWTLRHPNPGPGLEELMPGTGVYVSEKGLNECKIRYVSSTEFTRGLLEEIFTDAAIKTCSYTGQPPRSMPGKESYQAKPGLDLNARQTLVDYSLKYSGEKGWLYGDTTKEDTDRIINSIKGKLYDANKKSM